MTHVQLDEAHLIGETIRAGRIRLDLTKAEAARRAGVSRRTWHEVEEGQRPTTTAETLALFDAVLGLDEGTLLAMTAKGRNVEVEQLRRRLVELARQLSAADLRDVVGYAEGRSTELGEMRSMLEAIRADIDNLTRPMGTAGART